MAAGGALIGLLVLLVIVVVPLVVGIVLITTSRRGGLDYPACGSCQYNLSATVGTADRCPECGSLFTKVGILAPRGRRRPTLFWSGVALILIPIAFFGMIFSVFAYRASTARIAVPTVQSQPSIQADQSQDAAAEPPADTPIDSDAPSTGGESE